MSWSKFFFLSRYFSGPKTSNFTFKPSNFYINCSTQVATTILRHPSVVIKKYSNFQINWIKIDLVRTRETTWWRLLELICCADIKKIALIVRDKLWLEDVIKFICVMLWMAMKRFSFMTATRITSHNGDLHIFCISVAYRLAAFQKPSINQLKSLDLSKLCRLQFIATICLLKSLNKIYSSSNWNLEALFLHDKQS